MFLEKPITFVVARTMSGDVSLPVLPVVPKNWQFNLPPTASTVVDGIDDLHRLLFYVVAAAFVILMVFLGWVLLRYNRHLHPVARKGDRNALAQAAWVCLPVIVLVFIAIPSLRLLYFEASQPKADIVVDVVGRVGAWTYEYPDLGDIRFDAHLLDRKTAQAYRQPYLLAADYPLEVPVGRTVELRITSADVIHSWSVPSLGVRMDAIPGRINRVWFKATKLGLYYGMCSEMCGSRRDYMPIAVKVVSGAEFKGWLAWAEGKFSANDAKNDVADGTMTGMAR